MPWPAACLPWDSTAKPSSCTKLASKKERYESWCNMRYGIFILQWFSERRDCASYLILPQLPSLPPKYFLCHPFFSSISYFGMGCSQAVRSDKKAGGQGEAGYLIFCTSVLRPAFSSASSKWMSFGFFWEPTPNYFFHMNHHSKIKCVRLGTTYAVRMTLGFRVVRTRRTMALRIKRANR